jgi:Domain of unknown function (DUF397)
MSDGMDRAVEWFRSKSCSDSACVEIASSGDDVLIRSSNHPEEVVRCTPSEWRAFIAGVEAGDFPF